MKNKSSIYTKIIRKIRELNGLTQAELAEMVGVGKTAVGNYESGYSTPSIDTFDKIAAAFGFSLAQLCALAEENIESDCDLPRLHQSGSDKTIAFLAEKNVRSDVIEARHFMDNYITVPAFMMASDDRYICIKAPDNALSCDGICKNDFLFVRICKHPPEKSLVLLTSKNTKDYYIRRYMRDSHMLSFLPGASSGEYSIIRFDERDSEYEMMGYVEKTLTNIK